MAGERGRTGSPGATAARGADRSSILPLILGAIAVAALLIVAVWLISGQNSEDEDVPTNEVDVPAVEPGLEDGTGPLPEEGGEDLVDEGQTQPLGDDDTGAGMGEEEEGVTVDD